MSRRRIVFATLLLACASATMTADAQGLVDRRGRNGHRSEQGGGISKDEAIQRAERKFNARVVKADTLNDGDRLVYQFRLLNSEGKVWNVRVDAATGRMY